MSDLTEHSKLVWCLSGDSYSTTCIPSLDGTYMVAWKRFALQDDLMPTLDVRAVKCGHQ